MPVYAFDIPPHQYVRLSPKVGADIALVGPLPDGGFEQLLGSASLLEGLRHSRPAQILLDLSAAGELGPASLRWMSTSLASSLVEGGMQHLAVVLPATSAHFAEDLRNIAAEQNPSLAFACFPEQSAAVRWLATRVPGVGAATSPEEVSKDVQQGRLLEAIARYRAMYAASLASAVEVIEAMIPAARAEAGLPMSMIPSTEQPPAPEPRLALAPTVFEIDTVNAPYSGKTSEQPPPALPHAPQTATQASLGEQAAVAIPASEQAAASTPPTAPEQPPKTGEDAMFDEEWTVARDPGDALFPQDTSTPEEDFAEARQRGSFDILLRSLLSKAWYVAVNDKGVASAEFLDTGRCVQAFDESRPGSSTLLGGARLSVLLNESSDQVRFSPGSLGEVTLRKHQLAYARSFLAGLRVEALLPSMLSSPESRQHCLNHSFLVLLEVTERAERAATTTAPQGGLAVQLFTLSDAALRFLQARPAALAGRKLGLLAEQGDALLEKLLTLPIEGVFVNSAGPGDPLFFSREQLTSFLQAPASDAASAPAPRGSVAPPAASSTAPSGTPSAAPPGSASPPKPFVPPPPPPPPPFEPPSVTSPPIEPAPAILLSDPEPEPEPPPVKSKASPLASSMLRGPSAPLDPSPRSEAAMSVRDADLGASTPVLRARSLAEVHFFLDVRGQSRQDRYQWSEARGADTVWIFHTKGPGNEAARFEFLVRSPDPGPQGGYFGEGASPLFGPVELLQLSGSMAQSAAGSPNGLSRDELAESTRRMEMAYILVMEALRFFGPADQALPASTLKTDDERRALAREPERFARARVEEVARSYWLLASQLGEALRGGA